MVHSTDTSKTSAVIEEEISQVDMGVNTIVPPVSDDLHAAHQSESPAGL